MAQLAIPEDSTHPDGLLKYRDGKDWLLSNDVTHQRYAGMKDLF
jgi:hypothetical protein